MYSSISVLKCWSPVGLVPADCQSRRSCVMVSKAFIWSTNATRKPSDIELFVLPCHDVNCVICWGDTTETILSHDCFYPLIYFIVWWMSYISLVQPYAGVSFLIGTIFLGAVLEENRLCALRLCWYSVYSFVVYTWRNGTASVGKWIFLRSSVAPFWHCHVLVFSCYSCHSRSPLHPIRPQ